MSSLRVGNPQVGVSASCPVTVFVVLELVIVGVSRIQQGYWIRVSLVLRSELGLICQYRSTGSGIY